MPQGNNSWILKTLACYWVSLCFVLIQGQSFILCILRLMRVLSMALAIGGQSTAPWLVALPIGWQTTAPWLVG